jgi:L-threonylcarbamoyladenylate synthase
MSDQPFLSDCTADSIREAARAIKAGHLVAFPTETVYGLGADARNPDAVKRIYEVKGRPTDHPLIVHISSMSQLDKWASEIPDYAISLARAFWPGPMTLILKRSDMAKDFITGGQNTVGLRVPRDTVALALLNEFERLSDSAIAAPSANRFGQVSPTSSSDVFEELGEYLTPKDTILNGGNSVIGIESTIIDCSGRSPMILRTGFVTKEAVESTLGIEMAYQFNESKVKFSGSFELHYAPKCLVLLGEHQIAGAGFLALSEIATPARMVRLANPNNIEEFAQILYATFRAADRNGLKKLVVYPPRGEGLAKAIRERLDKASAKQE